LATVLSQRSNCAFRSSRSRKVPPGEVFADVAERPLDLAFGLRPIGTAGLRQIAVMLGKLAQRPVVDDRPSSSSPMTAVFMRS
jgi:hypothetical protein